MREASFMCSRCQAEWEPNAEYCAVCGAARHYAEPQPAPAAPLLATVVEEHPLRKSGLADNPTIVLATIFLVTAAFGIPLIWMCPAWSLRTKWLLTWVTIAYTILILTLFAMVMTWCYGRIMQSL